MAHLVGLLLTVRSPDLSSQAEFSPTEPAQSKLSIGLIQGNIPTRVKLSPAGIRQGLANYIQGYELLSDQGAQLILLPEGAMPFEWEISPENPLAQVIRDRKTPIALGSFGLRGDRMTQAFMMLNEQAQIASQYDKIKVVPLGESLPFESVLGPFIRRLSTQRGFLLAGREDQTFSTNFGPAAIGICYESAFPEIIRAQVQRGGTFIITSSNLDPYSTVLMAQHEAHDLMRAIENQRDVVRVTNTGYSGLIRANGSLELRSTPNQWQIELVELQPHRKVTLYTKYGNWITPILVGMTTTIAIAIMAQRRWRQY